MKHSFKDLLKAQPMPVGTILQIPSEELVEAAGYSGFQFVIIDCEHAYTTNDRVMSLIRTAENAGLVAFVRVPNSSEAEIKKALDMGASGVVVPNVNNAEEARQIVRFAKFHPLGQRGVCPYVRANRYGIDGVGDFFEDANAKTTVFVLVETPEGFRNIDEIMRVEGIDLVLGGVYDLSVALGLSGQLDHPEVLNAMHKARRVAQENGKAYGGFAATPAEVRKQADEGADFLIYGTDTFLVADMFKKTWQGIEKALGNREQQTPRPARAIGSAG